MKPLSIFSFLLLIVSLCYGQMQDSTMPKDTIITILTYGYPGRDLFEYGQVAKKYNFKLIAVAGCIVSPSLKDSVARHNKIAYEQLDKLNGENWQDRYESDVKQTYGRDTLMINALKKEKFIIDKYGEEEKHHNGLDYFVDSSLGNNIYRINVIGWLDTTSTLVSFYRVYMDFTSLSIIRKEDIIQVVYRWGEAEK